MCREAKRLHFKSQIAAMDDYDIKGLIRENLVAFVCSTTGQGNCNIRDSLEGTTSFFRTSTPELRYVKPKTIPIVAWISTLIPTST